MKLFATICIATYAAATNLTQHTLLAQTTQDDPEVTCNHYCYGKSCGWDCLGGGELVGSCYDG